MTFAQGGELRLVLLVDLDSGRVAFAGSGRLGLAVSVVGSLQVVLVTLPDSRLQTSRTVQLVHEPLSA